MKSDPVQIKLGYFATLADSRAMVKRIRSLAMPHGYTTALFGSTLLSDHGHDIDLLVMGTDAQDIAPQKMAQLIIDKLCRQFFLYEFSRIGNTDDIWMIFDTRSNLLLDIHLKGIFE